MISMKVLRRPALCISQSVVFTKNNDLSLSGKAKQNNNIRGCISAKNNVYDLKMRLLSTSSYMGQPAPLLTPKAPKVKESTIREIEISLPPKPKKPHVPWIVFLRENKDKFDREKHKKVSEIAVELAKEWSNTDKTRYELDYQKRHEVYRREMELYENSLTDEHRSVIELKKKLMRESKAIKKLRSTKPPTLPRNPANLYCIDRCKDPDVKEQMKLKKSAYVLRDLFAEYRNLDPAEMEKYIELQHKDKLRFQGEFNKWYDSINSDSSLSKTVHDKANNLHARFKALNWI